MNFWKSKLSFLYLYPKHKVRMGYKYSINHEFFDKIDSEFKAYILGFIYADGSITHPKDRQLKLTISLQEEDGYILKNFEEQIGGKLHIYHPLSIKSRGWKKRASISISSSFLCRKLISYGCSINKSRVGMAFPNIEEGLVHHFIRGFLDGDGSIILKKLNYKYKRKTTNSRKDTHIQQHKLRIAFCSTDLVFLETVAEYLPIKKFYINYRQRTQLVYILWIENKEDVKSCLDYLYKDANYFLKRKHDKIEELNKTIKSQAGSTLPEGLETT